MSRFACRGVSIALLLGLNAALLAGCAVTDGGNGYNSSLSIGLDYYEPWWGDGGAYGGYGGWGPGYRVGPPRQPMPRPPGGPPHRGGYRPPSGGHPVPTIPSRPHPGGQRPHR